jgi:hypothetical protein
MPFLVRLAFAFWPGCLPAWRRGDARGLAIAILFAVSLSTAWVASTVWPLWISQSRLIALWGTLGAAACVSAFQSVLRGHLAGRSPESQCPDEQFQKAQQHYLKAEYFEAEQILLPYCQPGRVDVEAALLLASVLKRTERYQLSYEWLEEIALLDRAAPWHEEIEREKRLVLTHKIRMQSESLSKS